MPWVLWIGSAPGSSTRHSCFCTCGREPQPPPDLPCLADSTLQARTSRWGTRSWSESHWSRRPPCARRGSYASRIRRSSSKSSASRLCRWSQASFDEWDTAVPWQQRVVVFLREPRGRKWFRSARRTGDWSSPVRPPVTSSRRCQRTDS